MTAGEWVIAGAALILLSALYGAVDRVAHELGRIALVAESEERRRDELERDIRAMR